MPLAPNANPIDEYATLGEQILSRASSAPASHNNQVSCLYDSTENFPEWETALNHAEESILIEMYIFDNDEFGSKIRNILIKKARTGVCVVLIYDWFGSIKSHYSGFFKPLIEAGATVAPYNKPSFSSGVDLLARNHRKLIIVDRQTVFVSGLCFSGQWQGNPAKNKQPWRDTGVKLTGPIVVQALDAFYDTLTSENIPLPERLLTPPESAVTGKVTTRLVAGKPGTGNMIRLDLFIIGLAQETLWITDAYFMATGTYLNQLKNAAQDGVDVRLLVPNTSDIAWIGAVSRTQYRSLLQAGVRIFEWNGAMIHAKSCVADGYWARIGSTNLNLSSWLANREIDITIQDRTIAESLQTKFLEDLNNATEVILNEKETAELKAIRPKKRNSVRAKASAAARQAMRLGGYLRGNTRTIGRPENMALLSLSVFVIVLAVLFFLFPKLIAYPLALLLTISGTMLAANAINQQIKDKKNKSD